MNVFKLLFLQFLSWAKMDGNDTLTKFEKSSAKFDSNDDVDDTAATKDSKTDFEQFYQLSIVIYCNLFLYKF